MNFFTSNKELKAEAERLFKENERVKVKSKLMDENATLKQEIHDTKLELKTLKHKKKLEEEDIKHMIKIDRERKDLEVEKEKVRLNGECDQEIAMVKDQYRDKMEENLHKQVDKMDGMYKELLGRLPNITAHIGDPLSKKDS